MTESRKKYPGGLLDRRRLGSGPWDAEPDDEVCWKHPTENVGCVLRRNKFAGSWVVLVAVPPGHPLHGADPCLQLPETLAHSGTVYSGNFAYEVPGLDTTGWWWLGFDTHHPLAPVVATERFQRKVAKLQDAGRVDHEMCKSAACYERERREHYKDEGQTKILLEALVARIQGITRDSVKQAPSK
jgi:hypothetical protein